MRAKKELHGLLSTVSSGLMGLKRRWQMKSHSKIKPIKSVLMKGAYLFGMKPKSIAKNFNVSLASVYRHVK